MGRHKENITDAGLDMSVFGQDIPPDDPLTEIEIYELQLSSARSAVSSLMGEIEYKIHRVKYYLEEIEAVELEDWMQRLKHIKRDLT